ncbi:enoyl-CoA hydratase/isomerase family protein [Pseudocnuella soli]|uniref:enoyl-CoA hydratase/isomerase family protein n=1 Tax=Pseudocnuella soli TaxID=2502779 RepID=UPI001046E27B|nr:enoyl-CoA hydratase/isomerase family protein [Pseudocnuella soli]
MIPDFDNGYVTSETHQGITTIEFFHPQGNSLPRRLLDGLAHEIHACGGDAATRVIVLRSGGEKAFCAGASFSELSAITDAQKGFQFFSGFAHVINAIRSISKLVIARVHGRCVGGGVGLAAAADYAIAVDGADVRLSELAIGIGPFVIGPAVERKIGASAFAQLAIDATMWRNSDWAKKKGLFAEVHPTVEGMDESISRLANQLAQSNPEAMAEMKKMFWSGTEHWNELLPQRAEISGWLALSRFTQEAISKLRVKA